MRVTVRDIAGVVGGSIIGDADQLVTGISSLTEAASGDISFLANPKYAPYLAETKATAVLVASAQETGRPIPVQIVVANPDFAFATVVATFGPKAVPPPTGVHPTAIVGERVRLGSGVAIGAYVVIGDDAQIGEQTVLYPHVYVGNEARIGANCLIYPQVSIRERCRLGDRVIIHPGAVVGSDGFGYATVEGVHHKIPQVGVVIVEDDVEIGANTTIDRARFGKTSIGKGTKIDNLVQIAHNVEIGRHCFLVSQAGVAGSTRLGNHVTLAGQCGLAGHLTIGDQAVVTGQSGVSKSVPPKMVVRGSPAQEFKTAQATEIAVRRLPNTQAQVKDLLARVAELEKRLALLQAKP
ncbi:MAG: UDP-3-O-(3-hydroxymyristoyl)glucosamine N-acyltransferase [Planctomycetes bacterium]|nr:UDP-3-O-(3-hydroxymyristoyl)glucosamine N-acyltransferase [Planctomycetota bacterium]